MNRAPNLAISQWFRRDGLTLSNWVEQALCRGRLDLPWVEDVQPESPHLITMTALCQSCPVRERCATEAIEADGGFYAGVWMPWLSGAEDVRAIRSYARRQLRRIAGLSTVGRPRGPRKPYAP